MYRNLQNATLLLQRTFDQTNPTCCDEIYSVQNIYSTALKTRKIFLVHL